MHIVQYAVAGDAWTTDKHDSFNAAVASEAAAAAAALVSGEVLEWVWLRSSIVRMNQLDTIHPTYARSATPVCHHPPHRSCIASDQSSTSRDHAPPCSKEHMVDVVEDKANTLYRYGAFCWYGGSANVTGVRKNGKSTNVAVRKINAYFLRPSYLMGWINTQCLRICIPASTLRLKNQWSSKFTGINPWTAMSERVSVTNIIKSRRQIFK